MEVSAQELARFFESVLPHLNERQRRVVAGAAAQLVGNKSMVAEAAGMSRNTVIKAEAEVAAGMSPQARQRPPGAGQRPITETQPGILGDLDHLVAPETRGDPMSLLRWTAKSTYNLADELVRLGYKVSADTVGRLLKRLGYSLQAPSKQVEGARHPDRDGQFRYLDKMAQEFVAQGQPAISVDTKKKELVGNFSNGGQEWQPKGEPERVKVHDFVDKQLGRAVPYGVYDLANDEGWVSVGATADTAEFAVNSIRAWWQNMGSARFPAAARLLITADAGGSNGYRLHAWKLHLAKLADELGLEVTVCHYPPGTSKWNKIEHRMFSFITMNWRGRPLVSYRTIVELISATEAKALKVRAEHDPRTYKTKVKVTKAEQASVPLEPHSWHGEWNYTIRPSAQSIER